MVRNTAKNSSFTDTVSELRYAAEDYKESDAIAQNKNIGSNNSWGGGRDLMPFAGRAVRPTISKRSFHFFQSTRHT